MRYKTIKRTFEQVAEIIEKTNGKQAVLKELKTEIEPDEYQWDNLDYLQHEYHLDYNDNLIIDESAKFTQADVEKYGKEQVLEWISRDAERLNRYHKGYIWDNGVRAVAVIAVPLGKGTQKSTRIKSAGLYGVPSDSGDSYIDGVEQEELYELVKELEILNVAGLEEIKEEEK